MSILKKKPEEVKCNHIFNEYIRENDYKRMCHPIHLKCAYCGEVTTVNVSDGLLTDLYHDLNENGILLR